jgi:hypothetical protein
LVAKGLAVPKPPLWGKDNNLTKWWSINNFEILSTCYQHEVEIFLKVVAPYFPKGQELDNFPEIRTPTGKSVPPSSVTEIPMPQGFKCTLEEPHNHFHLPPLSISSGRNLTRLISNAPSNISEREINSNYPPRTSWNNRDDLKNPFLKDNDPQETKNSQERIPK